MQSMILAILMATMPWPAAATCPGHSNAITATPEGTFRMCPQEVDAAGVTVGPSFYRECSVVAIWPGGTATVTVATPVPGVPVVVGFPAATGVGGATATCTNSDGLKGAISASTITFKAAPPLPAPKPPALAP